MKCPSTLRSILAGVSIPSGSKSHPSACTMRAVFRRVSCTSSAVFPSRPRQKLVYSGPSHGCSRRPRGSPPSAQLDIH